MQRKGEVLCEQEMLGKRWNEYFASQLQGEMVQQNEHSGNASVGKVPALETDEKISMDEVPSSMGE